MHIEGETAFVTGGARGIGRKISQELAERGLTVVVADLDGEDRRETVAEIEAAGNEAIELHLDLTEPDSITEAIETARERLDRIDVLVNNAGIAGPTAPIEDVEPEEFDRTLAVNLRGAFLCTRAVIGEMKARGYGRIVNISSSSGKRAVENRSPYTSSKAGLLGLTRTAAAEGGPHGVTANAICPGPVAGPRIERVIDDRATATGRPREEIVAEKERESLTHSFVEPEDVARTVAYLCSDATDRITGQALNVDGGKLVF